VARPTIVVDHYTYEGTDAHRTLQLLGELWSHHVHGGDPAPEAKQQAADDLAGLFAPLAGSDDASLAPLARVTQLGKHAADRIDEADSAALQRALREMWAPLATLARAAHHPGADHNGAEKSTTSRGVVAGLFMSDGGVPKTSVDAVEIGYRGVVGDRQGSRQHHGRPWQALCLWSADVVAGHAAVGHPITFGAAGENVSIRGVDWSMWRPGQRVRFGEVEATIMAYAIPCTKNARWFADGDYERMSHERPDGSRLYARVDRPGRLSVGDRATLQPQ
jgi:MOSC domain-containing protein YiiM